MKFLNKTKHLLFYVGIVLFLSSFQTSASVEKPYNDLILEQLWIQEKLPVIKGGEDLYKRIDEVTLIIVNLNKKYDKGKELRPGQLSSAINSASYYENVADQGSSIFYSLVTGHVFENGVKRTARDFLLAFAQSNDLTLKLSPKKIKKLARKLAKPKEDGGLRYENGMEELSKKLFELP